MKRLIKSLALVAALSLLITCMPLFSATMSVSAAYENTHINTGNQQQDIVAIAKTQIGYLEGTAEGTSLIRNNYSKYGQWYEDYFDAAGFANGEWCAMFVSWCAYQAGVSHDVAYYHAYCPYGVTEFKNRGQWHASLYQGGSAYTPQPGDYIYFLNTSTGNAGHIGLVTGSDGSYVYTVEGNTSTSGYSSSGGTCNAKSYSLSSSRILGYASPAYEDNSGYTITFETNGGNVIDSINVKEGATLDEPTAPIRYGFDFAGWYCDPELTDPYDFENTTVWYEFTLYAKWTETSWDENTNLMPNESQMIINSYNDADEHIWAYFNDDAYGSVTMYSGVNEEWAWPSVSMNYENSFNSATDAYIYVKKDGTAKFNADITYMDRNGTLQSVKLSEIAGQGTTDFAEGPMEFFVNIGQYIYNQGHLSNSGIVKFTKVTYYVIGSKDSYVTLYDMKFTEEFPIDGDEDTTAYVTLMDPQITQSGDSGSYVYDNGTLTVNSTGDLYSVTWDADASFDPSALSQLMMDVESDAPFTITMNVLRADGEAAMELKNEFFNHFGLSEAPTTLPAGKWNLTAMDLNGYFEWNGGAVANTTVSSVTVTVYGSGTLTLKALQSSNGTAIHYVEDGMNTSGTWGDTLSGDINGDGMVSTADARLVLMYTIGGAEFTSEQCALADVNGDGAVSTLDARMILLTAITA